MNTNNLKMAIGNGAARIRRLAHGYVLISVPDMEFAALLMNPAGQQPLFDFTKCRRMSRGAAHRVVDSMDDASTELKHAYHQLIDERRGEVGA